MTGLGDDKLKEKLMGKNKSAQILYEEFEASIESGEVEKAIILLKKCAQENYGKAQYDLGNRYIDGDGVDENPEEGFYWLKLAAERGVAKAQSNLGICYLEGKGVEQDYMKAFYWSKLAAEQGLDTAQLNFALFYLLGEGVEQDKKEFFHWTKLAAEQGLAQAEFCLGNCYLEGEGVEQDPKEGFRWMKRATEQGHPDAEFGLSVCYLEGEGVEQDLSEGFRWMKRAADQGMAEAQFNVGICWTVGKGVEQDKKEGFRWTKLAAEQGLSGAQYKVGVLYGVGSGTEQDDQASLFWYKIAAEQGNSDAQLAVGFCYMNDLGIPDDYFEFKNLSSKSAEVMANKFKIAMYWIMRSSDQGNTEASKTLDKMVEIYKARLAGKVVDFPKKMIDEDRLLSIMQQNFLKSSPELQTRFLESINRPSHVFDYSIESLLQIDENHSIEFKETFSVSTKLNHEGKAESVQTIRYAALKEIAGFLNTNDGVLLIGVADGKNTKENKPKISGIEKDNFNGDKDKYSRTIYDLVKSAFGETKASLIQVDFHSYDGKTVCKIACKKSSEPVYCNYKNFGEKPFVRYGSSTIEPVQKEWLIWVKEKFN